MMRSAISWALAAWILAAGCNTPNQQSEMPAKEMRHSLDTAAFGVYDGNSITQYTLKNASGMEVSIMNYGGTVTNLVVPDRDGNLGDVVLGFDDLEGYLLEDNPYFGCLVGRYANRIANAQFELEGITYQLAANNGENSLHGGLKGFDKVVWDVEIMPGDSSLRLSYSSPDGEEGYPGRLEVGVTYALSSDNELIIEYKATTNKSTPINLTNHCYFNLSAGADSTIMDHELMLKARQYTEVNESLIPTGNLPNVEGMPMDFRQLKRIGDDLDKVKGGYDHNWVLDRSGEGLEKIGELYHPGTGRLMEIFTNQPGIQFYSGNFLDGSLTGKHGRVYVKHGGLCLETQHFPDSPNQLSFPNTILRPGEEYHQKTIYKFSTR